MDDHDDTPDDRPDPADEGQDKLQDTDDDVRKVAVEGASDDGADAKEEAVEDAADECDHPTPRSLESGDVQNHVAAETHCCCGSGENLGVPVNPKKRTKKYSHAMKKKKGREEKKVKWCRESYGLSGKRVLSRNSNCHSQ